MIMGAYCVGKVIMGAYCEVKVHNMLPWWYYGNGTILCR